MTDTDTGYREPSAMRVSLRTAAILLVFMLIFTALMAGTFGVTAPLLEASAQAERLRLINEILPAKSYDNDLLHDQIVVPAATALNTADDTHVYRARLGDQPVAIVVEAIALDGYSGQIALLLAISKDGRLLAQRVVRHKETPGLGDYIDPKKDRNKQRPWITQFNQLGFDQVPLPAWRVKKDGGHFDQMTGATISARAVTNASARALVWVNAHHEALFSLAAGSRLESSK
ncbi:MAG: electron transport complex subunit RsxG [Rhodocyclaceae bacterium]|nr:electron transport complex subunit RsxG [Rhodocyclaceae bacterium]MBP6110105.1 electron transport complex subunit RsxG [Rhodocyclaceae bacterium]MBP6279873.1 electron transport complex subunit RsxG [Rhodocyclaceae bacterium]